MSDISTTSWSETDSSNNQMPPFGWPANMLPNKVEPTARMMMGAIKRSWNRENPVYLTTQSTADSYVITPTDASPGYNLYELISFRANIANASTSPTLLFSGLPPQPFRKMSASSVTVLAAGDIRAKDHKAYWDGSRWILQDPVISSDLAGTTGSGPIVLANGATIGTPAALVLSNATGLPSAGILTSTSGSVVALLSTINQWSGAQRNSATPMFSAMVGSTIVDVTGDGTAYTVIFNTEAYDQASNYDNTTGIFTAPLTGKYHFSGHVRFAGMAGAANTLVRIQLVTTLQTYTAAIVIWTTVSGVDGYGASFSLDVPMNATNTASVSVRVDGSTKTVDISNDTSAFSGHLIF